ncbi:hypothetical protein J4D99_01175 [Siccationidurans ginsengisoli]|nr:MULTISPECIES: hypothetical protein [unclassified Hymenobacter]MBO2029986.1 hypothetical protein [Hymenobacter sp. BT559]
MHPLLTGVRVVIGGTNTVKPHHVTTLACLLDEYRRARIAIRFEEANAVVFDYLRIISFFAQWDTLGNNVEISTFQVATDSTSFILWRAEPTAMNAYIQGAYQHYSTSFFKGKNLTFLTTYLAELFNNVFDHAFNATSSNRVAFGMVQYYPSRRRLFIAVSDFGLGIPKTINHFLTTNGQEPVTATEAL